MVGKRAGGPWYSDEVARLKFERSTPPRFRVRRDYVREGPDAGLRYRVTIPVPGYQSRQVEIRFPNGLTADSVRVYADGPDDSPHRFDSGALCIWDPKDLPERRWLPEEGLGALLDHIAVHLFKEAWWRDTGEWLGEEAPHCRVKDPAPRRIRRATGR